MIIDDIPEPVPEVVNTVAMINHIAAVPTVYADACIFAVQFGGNVRLTFVESILGAADSATPGLHTRHVGHLVMSHEGFRGMYQYFTKYAEQLGIADAAEPEQPAAE